MEQGELLIRHSGRRPANAGALAVAVPPSCGSPQRPDLALRQLVEKAMAIKGRHQGNKKITLLEQTAVGAHPPTLASGRTCCPGVPQTSISDQRQGPAQPEVKQDRRLRPC